MKIKFLILVLLTFLVINTGFSQQQPTIPVVYETNVTPEEIELGESVSIQADVAGSIMEQVNIPIENVWAEINGTFNLTMDYVEGNGNEGDVIFRGTFKTEYEPETAGNYSVVVYIENKPRNRPGNIANGTTEYFNVISECPEPEIIYANITPNQTTFGNSVKIETNVTGTPPIKNVWAEINGHSRKLEISEGTNLSGTYILNYFSSKDGNFLVTIFAENMCGALTNKSAGNFIILPPEEPPGPVPCGNISKIGLAQRPGVLDEQKLEYLLDLNYYCTKNILGLWEYEMFIEITNLDGTYIKVNQRNFFYGKAPGRPQVAYGMEGESLTSPYYSVVSDSDRIDQPLQRKTSGMMRFSRIALLESDSGYELVRLTFGVWN